MKRVLITGGSGFVGANLVRRLLRDGHEVHLILRAGHKTWRLDEIAGEFEEHSADLEDAEAIRCCVSKVRPDWVFHLAAYGAYPRQTGIERMIATNLQGSIGLLDACVDVGVEAFVHAGSSSEYGYKDHAAREDEVIQPNSHYAITKAAATHYCQYTAAQRGVKAVTVRLYSIYGPYEDPSRLIPALVIYGLRRALPPLAAPNIARDFVFIDDAVEAMLRVAVAGRPGATYNLCTGVQSTLADVVDAARLLMKVPAEPEWASMPARAWDTDSWLGSPGLTERELGWRARIDLRGGLQYTIDWMLSDPARRAFYEERILGAESNDHKQSAQTG
ncbi:MAG TPA: NAD-dependent epimerase/dehydratase family protein [Bryobacteraceae bacterium]|nr:NAD-dependent epimerase/dehydratase family protein [Bryobacteraceae bacterium]